MKKSRMFLAATLALGIAGAVVAKAHTTSVTYKYIDPVFPNACISGTFADNQCPTPANNDCTATVGTSTVQLYTSSGTCASTEKIKRN